MRTRSKLGGHGREVLLLALGLSLLGACSRKDQSARDASGAAGAPAAARAAPARAGSATAPAAPTDLASATPENPLRPDKSSRVLPLQNGAGSAPDGAPKLSSLRLPPGFSIEMSAPDVPNARSLARGPKGVVFVSNRQGDKVFALVDANGDYKLDKVQVVARGLDTPNGIAYKDGTLYIALVDRLLKVDKIDTKLESPPEPVLVSDKLPDREHHGWRYMRFGPDGWLYMPIGAPCNNCVREEPIFATIARMHADGTGLEVFASGVRNSVGFDWHPQTKELWFTENGRDTLGNDIPPDELDRAPKPGLDFGFPYCHAGVIIDPELGEGKKCTDYEPPVRALGAHVAALGMRFYTGSMFPAEYRNAVFIAEHGSWNREPKLGYRIMVVKLDGNAARSYEPFITGWLDEETDDVWGRPVDVELLDDGSLLISDDHKGLVYRVTYKG
jgi:glucose/arabinose dehydrogenase